jgi:hypothetical protein
MQPFFSVTVQERYKFRVSCYQNAIMGSTMLVLRQVKMQLTANLETISKAKEFVKNNN